MRDGHQKAITCTLALFSRKEVGQSVLMALYTLFFNKLTII